MEALPPTDSDLPDALKALRLSEEYAASIIEKIIPSHQDRALILGQLLSSIEIVETIAPDIFSLNLSKNGFRLNVGPVKVLSYETDYPEFFRIDLWCQGALSNEISEKLFKDDLVHGFFESNSKSVSPPQNVYSGFGWFKNGSFSDTALSHQKLNTSLNLLSSLHANFIEQATKTPTGKVWKASNSKRHNSLGLYLYAKSFLAAHTTSNNEVIDGMNLVDSIQNNQYEGKKYSVIASRYERNPQVREACLAHYGYSCAVCGFNFADTYGEAAKDYIHVHHLTPLASNGEQHEVDHVHDLRPVCANCHAVIHLRRAPDLPYSIEEVKNMLNTKLHRI